MRRGLASYALVIGALVLALVLILLTTAPPSLNDDPSSRAAGKAGTLALYTWLDNLGFRVHRITGQFNPGGSDVVVIADPRTPISDSDADAAMRSLARGADLIVAVSATTPSTSSALLDRLRIAVDTGRPAGDSVPSQPIDAGDRVHHVPTGSGVVIEPAPYLTPLLHQGAAITAVAEAVPGGGRAYVLASPSPLSNDGLRDTDSSTLVLTLLERARGGVIGFDEYHHGESQAATDGATAIFQSPVGLGLLLAVTSLVVYLAFSGRRLGSPVPAGDPSLVPSTSTYIAAMAGLYARSSDRGGVAARYADELRRRLALWVGGEAQPEDAALVAAVARIRPEMSDDVRVALEKAASLAAARPDAAALLSLAREIDSIERRWAEPALPVRAQSAR